MATWAICNYHDCEYPHRQKLAPNQNLNLDWVESFKPVGENEIVFTFQRNKPIIWKFIDGEIRDLECHRLNRLAGESARVHAPRPVVADLHQISA